MNFIEKLKKIFLPQYEWQDIRLVTNAEAERLIKETNWRDANDKFRYYDPPKPLDDIQEGMCWIAKRKMVG
jgi:hypothetical protein